MSNAIQKHQPMQQGQTCIALLPPDGVTKGTQGLCRMTAGGLVRSIFATIQLSEAKGETCVIQRNSVPTAAGYAAMNRVVGVSFYSPETLRGDDGTLGPNPMFRRNANGTVRSVTVRKMAMGRNAAGNLAIRDATVCYDLDAYRARDLFSKWQKGGCQKWGVLSVTPIADKMCVPVNGDVYLCVDLNSGDVLNALADDMHRRQFAERLANTICERNLLKAVIGVYKLPPDSRVSLVGWTQADGDFAAVMKNAATAQRGEVVIDGEVVKVESEAATAEPDDIEAEAVAAADETCLPDDAGEPEKAPEPAKQSDKAAEMVQQMRDIAEHLDGETLDNLVRGTLGYESWGVLAADTDEIKLGAALQQFKAAMKKVQDAEKKAQGELPLRSGRRHS